MGRKKDYGVYEKLFGAHPKLSSQTPSLEGEVEARKPHYLVAGGSPIKKQCEWQHLLLPSTVPVIPNKVECRPIARSLTAVFPAFEI